jgi:predicted nuclease of predicted toxin-antitoxin system
LIALLADENFPIASVARLRTSGFDVVAISEVARGAPDVDVLRMAREQNRVLITFDRDFGELIYRDLAPVPPGVIYLRVAVSSPEEPAQVITDLLTDSSFELLGRFSVVTGDGVRQRALG